MGYVGQAPAAGSVTTSDITDGTIANADIASDAAIAMSKTALSGGTGLTLSTNTLNVDAAQTQITSVGTIATGTWEGTTVAVDQGGTGATTLNNLITLATHTTGDYVQNITAGTGLTSTGATSGENIAHSLSVDAAQTGITSVGTLSSLVIANAGTIGSASDTDAIAISSGGVVTFSQNITLADNAVINLGEAGKIDFGDEEPADNAATGIVFSFIAGATLAIGDVVYMGTGGKVLKADANQVTTMPAIGICVSAGSDTNAVDVLVQGIMHDTSAFPTFSTVGADVFVSAAATGAVVATAPSGSGDTVQKIGVALHADMIYFNFNTTEVLLA